MQKGEQSATTRSITINMSASCQGCRLANIRLREDRLVELLQGQKTKLQGRLQQETNLGRRLKEKVQVLEQQAKASVQQKNNLLRMLADIKKNQAITQKQQLYVGFTPLDPKHRMVLQQCEEEIEALEAKLSAQTADLEEPLIEQREDEINTSFTELEHQMDKLQQRLDATNELLRKIQHSIEC